jgi:corrinoid protein of di/trimethylamine methyltransferase
MVQEGEKKQVMDEVIQSVLEYDPERVNAAVRAALSVIGLSPVDILEKGLTVGITGVGERFERGSIFLPELVRASQAMQEGVNILKTQWKNMDSERKVLGKMVIGTVKGDMHNIGKQIVGSLLEAAGFEFFDIGEDIPEEAFVEKVIAIKPDILGLSALLTTSMPHQGYVINALEKAGIRGMTKVMVGGAPTTEKWAKEIGADGWAPNAVLTVKQAKKLLQVD